MMDTSDWPNALYNCTHGFTGVQPGMKFEYFPPVGTGKVEEWVEQGWDAEDAGPMVAKTFMIPAFH